MVRWASAADLKANGTCCASATGTTVPMMPPIRVKNWISPASSFFSASGSPPGILLFSACTVVSTRPLVSTRTASHIATRFLCSVPPAGWLWYCAKVNSAARVGFTTMVDPTAVAPAISERRENLPVIVVSASRLEDFGDGNHRQCAGAARIVDARDGVDGGADLGGGEAVARREHARGPRPAVALGVIDLVRAEHAAEVLDPPFPAEHVDPAVADRNPGTRARRRHRRTGEPAVGGDVVLLVHPDVRRPAVREAGAHAPADGIELAVDRGDAVVIARRRHRRQRRPLVGLGVEHLERAVELRRAAADQSIRQRNARGNAAAAADIDLLADRDRGQRATRRRHRRQRRPLLAVEVEHPGFAFRIPTDLAGVRQAEAADHVEFPPNGGGRAVVDRHRVRRQLTPLVLRRIVFPEYAHRLVSRIRAAIDQDRIADGGADHLVGALRNGRGYAPFALYALCLGGIGKGKSQ